MGTDKSSARGVELRTGVKSESIRVKFMYRGAECRETLKLAHTKANIKFAERLRGEILNAIELGTFSYVKYFPESPQLKKLGIQPSRSQVTVGELLEEQFRAYEGTIAPSTLKVYRRNYLAHLKPQWHDTLLRDLTPAALRAWLGALTCKARTARQILVPLRSALDMAVNDDLIEDNPLERVKLKKVFSRESYKVDFVTDPFTADEISSILAACDGQERNVWQFAFATGMRPSEYIALQWGAIDWSKFTAKVERARVLGETSENTKTHAGKRLVDLRKGAFDAIVAQKQHSALADGLIFHDPAHGRGWNDTNRLHKLWIGTLLRAAVRYRNPYQTRHTFASTLLSTGENPMYVAKQLGHTDTTMITRTYGRWLEQDGGVLPAFYQRMLAGRARSVSS